MLSTCCDTLRHRNHVHISLSRAGGNGPHQLVHRRDHGARPVTPTRPRRPTDRHARRRPRRRAPRRTLVAEDQDRRPRPAQAAVRHRHGRRGAVKTTGFKLRKGYAYKVTAAGLYGYGTPRQVADASCRWSPRPRGLGALPGDRRRPRTHGSLNLLVNGTPISASDLPDHARLRDDRQAPSAPAPLKLQVANKPTGATGTLRVLVSRSTAPTSRPACRPYPDLAAAPTATGRRRRHRAVSETVAVPAASGTVSTAGRARSSGATYRLTVAGAADLGGGAQTDGRCVASAAPGGPQASLDRRVPDQAHGRLYVDGVRLRRRPPPTAAHSARPGRTRRRTPPPAPAGSSSRSGTRWPAATTPAQVTVTVQRLTPIATPRPRPPRPRPRPRRGRSAATPSPSAPPTPTGTALDDAGQGRAEVTMTARGTYVRQHRGRRVLRGHRRRLGHLRPVGAARPGAARAVGRRPARRLASGGRYDGLLRATTRTPRRSPPPRTARCGSRCSTSTTATTPAP